MQFIILNTIGLTGVEALQGRLSALESVLVLPSQNFTMFDQNLYRCHNYNGYSGDEVFFSLNKELRTKDGRIWMGIRKYMSVDMIESYNIEKHKNIFLETLGEKRDFGACLKAYVISYFEAVSPDLLDSVKYIFVYSANIALNLPYYGGSMSEFKIWNVYNDIDIWLASISQARTWNCIEACKYWLVNNLYLSYFAKTNGFQYRSFNWSEIVSNPQLTLDVMAKELGVVRTQNAMCVPGVIQPSHKFETKLINDAKILRKIYADAPLFQLADTFSKWSDLALKDQKIIELLNEYVHFWNSTGHTNFDWIGPIGERIINLLKNYCDDVPYNHNYSYQFYHSYFTIHSDSYSSVQTNLEHYLGNIEKEIYLPLLPYHLRVAIAYLKAVTKNYIFHAHSYIPIRRSSMYRRLANENTCIALKRYGLLKDFSELEELIDEAEAACNHLK